MFSAHQLAKQSLVTTQAMFSGSSKPENAKSGDYYFDKNLNQIMMYSDKSWSPLGLSSGGGSEIVSSILKDGRCTCCGAPDNGRNKCRYCRTVLRW